MPGMVRGISVMTEANESSSLYEGIVMTSFILTCYSTLDYINSLGVFVLSIRTGHIVFQNISKI